MTTLIGMCMLLAGIVIMHYLDERNEKKMEKLSCEE